MKTTGSSATAIDGNNTNANAPFARSKQSTAKPLS